MNRAHLLRMFDQLGATSHSSWSDVYNKALSLGECPDYARFLADRHAEMCGHERDIDNAGKVG